MFKIIESSMKFIEDHFDRVSPHPFFAWLIVSITFIFLSPSELTIEFVKANSTYLNITYGAVISTLIMLICCMLIGYTRLKEKPLKILYSVSRLFSDTAMGAAGFIAANGIYNEQYFAVTLLASGVFLYTLTGNHIYHSIFNENKGSRSFFKKIDEESNTRVGTGLAERDIERKVLAIASAITIAVTAWLVLTLYLVRH